jgi:hypothetical protein
MGKKGVTYIELVKIHLDKARTDAKKIGSTFEPKQAFSNAASQWKRVKEGKDTLYTQKSSSKLTRKRKRILPGHKGAPSKTRPGHIDFRTHKGDKYYNRKGHRQTYTRKGVVGTPFVHNS